VPLSRSSTIYPTEKRSVYQATSNIQNHQDKIKMGPSSITSTAAAAAALAAAVTPSDEALLFA